MNDEHSDITSQQPSTIEAQTQFKFNNNQDVRATESDVMQGLGNKDATLFLTGVGPSDANKATGWSQIMGDDGANDQRPPSPPKDVIAAQIVDIADQMANYNNP